MESETALIDVDAFRPARMAALAESAGVAKAEMGLAKLFVLAVLAGAFIGFGALFYMIAITGSDLGWGPTRLLGGLAFSLGLILVVLAGAELFTGNNLIVMAWAHGKVSTLALSRNWLVVYVGNLVGALALAVAVVAAGTIDGDVRETAIDIAAAKVELDPVAALIRGILCNALVCLAIWLCFAARRVSGKILAILFPITAFVAIGFEHSVANMFFLPLGLWADGEAVIGPTVANLIPVTLGNIVGGAGLVGGIYWFCYLRD